MNKESGSVPWAWVRKLDQMVQNGLKSGSEHPPLPSEITPWLYISNESSALEKAKLQDLGITHVLSVNGVPSYQDRFVSDFYETLGITHFRIHAEDEEGYEVMDKHWGECYDFIKAARENESCKVVVHCVAGINRSGIISCAAYMIMEKKSVVDAVQHCIEKRGIVLTNKSFQRQLCIFALEEGLLGTKPEGFSDQPIAITPPPPPPLKALERLDKNDTCKIS